MILSQIIPVVLLLLIGGVIGYYGPPKPVPFVIRRWLPLMGVLLVIVALLAMAAISTVVSVSNETLSARGFTMPVTALLIVVALWGFVMGLGLRKSATPGAPRPLLLIAIAALIVAGPLRLSVEALDFGTDYALFAAEWDARDATIREAVAAGQTELVVAPFTYDAAWEAWIEPLGADPERPYNVCAAELYGLETLVVSAPVQRE
jgi:hypothetical protein